MLTRNRAAHGGRGSGKKRKFEPAASPVASTGASLLQQTPMTIDQLSNELILHIFALVGRSGVHKPARLATVCKSWNQLLSAPSEVWHTVELTGSRAGATSAQQLEGSGLVAWLLQRRSAIRDITFKRMPVGNYTVSDGMLPILSNILGLLTAAAPLQSLRFIGSAVPPRLLPIMQSLPSLTRLEIGVVAGPPGDMLNVALSRLTGLQELTVVVRLAIHHPDNSAAAWPSNLRHCTRLRRLELSDNMNGGAGRVIPPAIGELRCLQSLALTGWMITRLPLALTLLTELQSVRIREAGVGRGHSHIQGALSLPPEMSTLSQLTRLAFLSTTIPEHLSSLTSLQRLSVGRLRWSEDVGNKVSELSVLTNIRALRLHDARGLYRTWLGLFTLLNALPLLDNLRLDGNSMDQASMGQVASRLTSLDLGRNLLVGVPSALRRAQALRFLRISFKAPLDLQALCVTGGVGQGGDPRSDGTAALLAMRRLRRLAVQQQSWSHAEVEQLLAAKEAFERSYTQRGGGAPRPPVISCPPWKDAPLPEPIPHVAPAAVAAAAAPPAVGGEPGDGASDAETNSESEYAPPGVHFA